MPQPHVERHPDGGSMWTSAFASQARGDDAEALMVSIPQTGERCQQCAASHRAHENAPRTRLTGTMPDGALPPFPTALV